MGDSSKKMEQVNTLKKNKGLQYLINEAYRILENPIILYDADWRILAIPDNVVTDDPIWNNHVNSGTVENNITTFMNTGFLDIMTRLDRVVFLSSEQLKYNRIFGKIFDKDNNLIAGVSVVGSNKPLEDDDLIIIEAICRIFSDEICKILYYKNYAQKKLEFCINMLIEREIESIEDRLYISRYVDIVYNGLKENLYLGVVDIARCDPAYAKLEYYRDLFKRTCTAFKYSIYSNFIVIIMSTDDAAFCPQSTLAPLSKLFKQEDIKVGISSRFENMFKLRRYYEEAVNALKHGLLINLNRQIFLYNEEI